MSNDESWISRILQSGADDMSKDNEDPLVKIAAAVYGRREVDRLLAAGFEGVLSGQLSFPFVDDSNSLELELEEALLESLRQG